MVYLLIIVFIICIVSVTEACKRVILYSKQTIYIKIPITQHNKHTHFNENMPCFVNFPT